MVCFVAALSIRQVFSVETAAPISTDIATELSNLFKKSQTRQSSAICDDLKNGNYNNVASAISGQCLIAIQGHPNNPYNGAICTSSCNDLYEVFVQCYGAEATQIAYKSLCSNGYQGGTHIFQGGPAGHATAHYAVVALSMVATTFVMRGILH